MTTETTQQAPAALLCDNPDHAEMGVTVPAVYRTTWPDGRFKPGYDCAECLDELLQLYVLDDGFDGRCHPVLIELAADAAEADEVKAEHLARDAQLLAGSRMLSAINARLYRVMEAARIELHQNGAKAAMEWILNSIEPVVPGEADPLAWDGTESAQAWFDRVEAADKAAEAEAAA